jgi:hypothetical protein
MRLLLVLKQIYPQFDTLAHKNQKIRREPADSATGSHRIRGNPFSEKTDSLKN